MLAKKYLEELMQFHEAKEAREAKAKENKVKEDKAKEALGKYIKENNNKNLGENPVDIFIL